MVRRMDEQTDGWMDDGWMAENIRQAAVPGLRAG